MLLQISHKIAVQQSYPTILGILRILIPKRVLRLSWIPCSLLRLLIQVNLLLWVHYKVNLIHFSLVLLRDHRGNLIHFRLVLSMYHRGSLVQVSLLLWKRKCKGNSFQVCLLLWKRKWWVNFNQASQLLWRESRGDCQQEESFNFLTLAQWVDLASTIG